MYLVNLFASGVNKVLDSNTVSSYRNILNENYCREVYYNYALLFIELGDYKSGYESLSLFETLLKKDEDKTDIQTVTILKDYIQYRAARQEEYQKPSPQSYEKMEEETTDSNLRSVIRNNLIFLKGNHVENFHEALRNMD